MSGYERERLDCLTSPSSAGSTSCSRARVSRAMPAVTTDFFIGLGYDTSVSSSASTMSDFTIQEIHEGYIGGGTATV